MTLHVSFVLRCFLTQKNALSAKTHFAQSALMIGYQEEATRVLLAIMSSLSSLECIANLKTKWLKLLLNASARKRWDMTNFKTIQKIVFKMPLLQVQLLVPYAIQSFHLLMKDFLTTQMCAQAEN